MDDLYAEERRRQLRLEQRDNHKTLVWAVVFALILAALIVVPQR